MSISSRQLTIGVTALVVGFLLSAAYATHAAGSTSVESLVVTGNYPSTASSIELAPDPDNDLRPSIAVSPGDSSSGSIRFGSGSNPNMELNAGDNTVMRFITDSGFEFVNLDGGTGTILTIGRSVSIGAPVSNSSALFNVNGSAYVAGKLGIGTTVPGAQLEVTAGSFATTTVTIGQIGSNTSKSCVNMNRSNGQPASFYINAAGAMVVETHYCNH